MVGRAIELRQVRSRARAVRRDCLSLVHGRGAGPDRGREDRFFATVYTGSGLLFLAMGFVSAAAAGSLLATYGSVAEEIFDSGVYTYGSDVVYRISNVYAMRMAAVFMISLGTVGLRTKALPMWLNIVTYGLAASLLIVIGYSAWISLVFPAWVLVVSVHFLITNFRTDPQSVSVSN